MAMLKIVQKKFFEIFYPQYLSVHFRPLSMVHEHLMRGHAFNYFVSDEISMAPSSFANSAIGFWNALPSDLKEVQSLSVYIETEDAPSV